MTGYETRREQHHPGDQARLRVERLPTRGQVVDCAEELSTAWRRKFEGEKVPSFDGLVRLLISKYTIEDAQKRRVIDGTIRVARAWEPPTTIGIVIPDARVEAMDSIKKGEAEDLRKIWGMERKSIPSAGEDSFRLLLIACRALLMMEKHPTIYSNQKNPKIEE